MTINSVQLFSPKLTLFAFQLHQDLASGSQNSIEDADLLWQKCEAIGEELGILELSNLSSKLSFGEATPIINGHRELLPQRALSFQQIPRPKQLCLSGEVYPLQLHDTYAVDLTLRYPNIAIDLEQIEGLNPKQVFSPQSINSSLGQSLVLFASLLDPVKDLQTLADVCMKQFNLGELLCVGNFVLLGSPVFEYNNSTESCHLLIWLNCHPETSNLEEAGDYYQPLLQLLCYRNKQKC